MANVTITQLPQAGPILGTESVPIVQNGQTVQTTTAAIAASPSQTQTFLTLNSEATLPNSRYLSTGTGLGLADGGPLSFYRITLNRTAGSLESASTGIVVKDSASTVASRTLQASGAGLSVADGNGVSGNPTFSLTGLVASLANASGAGLLALPNNGSVVQRLIAGTTNEIDVTNANGAAGNPTIGLSDNPVLPGTAGTVVPSGDTAQRPGAPSNGTFRYNSQTATFEGYVNNAWGAITVDAGVSSVNASGGTTGMTFTGGPITSAGVLTLGGTLNVASGGTGVTTSTGSGSVVLSTSPSLTTPNLGTPSAVTLTNATGLPLSTGVTGVLPAANGGTGLSSYVAGDLIYATGTTTFAKLGIGLTNYVLTSSGTAPQYVAQSTLSVGSATTATNLAGGGASQIPYQTASGTTAFIANGTAGQVLTSAGAGAPVWSGISGGTF